MEKLFSDFFLPCNMLHHLVFFIDTIFTNILKLISMLKVVTFNIRVTSPIEVGELSSCLTESKNESPGQRRVSKAIEGYRVRIQKSSLQWEGSLQGCHWGLLGLVFYRKLTRELKSFWLLYLIAPLCKQD